MVFLCFGVYLSVRIHFLLGPEGAELMFRLRYSYFWLCRRLMRMHHGVPEIEMKDDLNFSAIANRDKQISRQISTIVFPNALVETLLIKLGDNALYVLFGSYRKTEQIAASRSMLFSNAAGAPVCFHAESTAANVTEFKYLVLILL